MVSVLLVFHRCLFQDAVHRARGQIIRGMSCNGDPAGLFRVFELAMAPFCRDQVPSISFDDPYLQDDTSCQYLNIIRRCS